jgi:hypothetical protein
VASCSLILYFACTCKAGSTTSINMSLQLCVSREGQLVINESEGAAMSLSTINLLYHLKSSGNFLCHQV